MKQEQDQSDLRSVCRQACRASPIWD